MRKTIETAVYDHAFALDVSGPAGVFSAATSLLEMRGEQDEGYTVVFTAMRPGPVRLDSGMTLLVEQGLGLDPVPDLFMISGGEGVLRAMRDKTLVHAVARAAGRARRIVSICNGAFLLAEAGLLDGRRATIHWMAVDQFSRRYPKVRLEPDALYVKDRFVYTSAGVTTGIDLALSIVEEDYGHELAMETARLLVVYYRRPGWQSQFSSPLEAQRSIGGRFEGLRRWVRGNLDANLDVESLAEREGMSPRNFARVFKKEMGRTPARFVEGVRLDRARELLEAGERDLERIAALSGFGREERLRRAFMRRFGISPRGYVTHFSSAGQAGSRDQGALR